MAVVTVGTLRWLVSRVETEVCPEREGKPGVGRSVSRSQAGEVLQDGGPQGGQVPVRAATRPQKSLLRVEGGRCLYIYPLDISIEVNEFY